MPIIRTDLPAVVLDCRDHGESDKIITFFCHNIGRLTGIAKGAHRSKKRFVNKLEIFSLLHITYSRSAADRLAVINEAELLNSFITLRSALSRYLAASVLREIILMATSERLRDDNLFQLILWTLHSLDSEEEHKTVIALFLIKLFDCIGYRPDLSHCQGCGTTYQYTSPAVFNIHSGGLICPKCLASNDFSGRHLSPGTIQTIVTTQQQPLNRLSRVKLSGTILSEVLGCFYRYGRHLFQRDIYSWKMFISAR